MMLSKLSPTTFIMILVALLSLMASLSTPVLIKDTGYNYETEENPTQADRYRDLKCTYLFSGLTQMRSVNLLLEDKLQLTNAVANLMYRYNIHEMICTIFNVPGVEIGSLWLLLLYVNTVQHYYEQFVRGSAYEADDCHYVDRLIVINHFVVGKMQGELLVTGCRADNRFDMYENWFKEKAAAMPDGKPKLTDIENNAISNCNELKGLLDANKAETTYGTQKKSLKSKALFFNDLGKNQTVLLGLMNNYNVQINWFGTIKIIADDLKDAHKMNSQTVLLHPLLGIKKYFKDVFYLLKGIMHRLTWKFLLYLKNFTGQQRGKYIKKWYKLLENFQKLLHIENDREITSLLDDLVRLDCKELAINDIIERLTEKLHQVNVTLLCEATYQITLQPGQGAIGSDSLKKAKDFISKLENVFQNVDFSVILSIMMYIDLQDITWQCEIITIWPKTFQELDNIKNQCKNLFESFVHQ